MKKCLNCNIEVGGEIEVCPLCQHGLAGEASANNWPYLFKLKKQALLYKIQLFVAFAAIVVGLGLDFLLGLNNGKHYSLLVTLAILVIESVLKRFLKKKNTPARIVSVSAFWVTVILLITSYYYNFSEPIVSLVIPILLNAIIVANWVLTIIDKKDNALVYLLASIFAAFVIYGILFFKKWDISLSWNICLMISVVSLIGMFVFRGRKVTGEVEKRMNI